MPDEHQISVIYQDGKRVFHHLRTPGCRKDDATKGHDRFLPSKAETGSENVFVNGD